MTHRQLQRLKAKFLEHFAEYGNVTQGAHYAGIDRTTVYRWQEHDDDFAAAFRDAEIQATETLESEARRRAVEGVVNETPVVSHGEVIYTITERKYSDTLLIFLLKARNPAKYRDNSRVEVEQSGKVVVEVVYDNVPQSVAV